MWLDQFEFAGFYAAKEKGFYKDVGLDVEFRKYDSSLNLLEEVLNKNADFGTNSSSLITDKSNGKDIALLAHFNSLYYFNGWWSLHLCTSPTI